MPRDPRDFYRTPAWCVSQLLKTVPLPEPTLDPCAGDGAILQAVGDIYKKSKMRGYELDEDLANGNPTITVCNGLEQSWHNEVVLMNPPFKNAEEWTSKAVREAKTTIVLLRLGFLASRKRHAFWAEHKPAALCVLSKRPSFTPDGRTDAANYGWFVWTRNVPSLRCRLDWILA